MEKPWLAHYEDGMPAEVDIPDTPITQNLINAAQRYPHRPALTFGSVVEPLDNLLLDTEIGYPDLLALTRRFAAALQQIGVEKGDRVAIYLPNCPQFIISYYGTLMAGGIAVPCNPQYVARELRHQLGDSGAKVIVTLKRTYPTVDQVRAESPLKHVLVADIKTYFPTLLKLLSAFAGERQKAPAPAVDEIANTHRFQELLESAPDAPVEVALSPEETAVLMYTGGTTGLPKGAQLTHRNLQANAVQVRYMFHRLEEGQEAVLAALPLFHSYGMTTCMNLCIRTGSTIILIPNPRNIVHILKSINKHRPSLYPGVPAMYIAINEHPAVDKFDIRSLKAAISGAAPLPGEVQRKFQQLTGGRLVEGYGLSEASPVTHANPVFYGDNRIGTIGPPLSSTEAKIVDVETGRRDLPPGEVGELVVRGPQVMKGYWQRPEETAQVLRDGWLHTGDLARMDEDGYFEIVDRKKDIILSTSGFKVYPREVEEVLYEHPKVKECAVVGVPTEAEGEERVKAFIVLQEGQTATEKEIRAFCEENLTYYKRPKFIEFRDQLPQTSVGKVLRRALREEVSQA